MEAIPIKKSNDHQLSSSKSLDESPWIRMSQLHQLFVLAELFFRIIFFIDYFAS